MWLEISSHPSTATIFSVHRSYSQVEEKEEEIVMLSYKY